MKKTVREIPLDLYYDPQAGIDVPSDITTCVTGELLMKYWNKLRKYKTVDEAMSNAISYGLIDRFIQIKDKEFVLTDAD